MRHSEKHIVGELFGLKEGAASSEIALSGGSVRVVASQIQLASRREAASQVREEVKVSAARGAPRPEAGDQVSLSPAARAPRHSQPAGASELGDARECKCEHAGDAEQDPALAKLRLFELVVRALAGHGLRRARLPSSEAGAEKSVPAEGAVRESGPRRGRGGLEVQWTRVSSEYERTEVAARGRVVTGDGRSIDFALRVDMQRRQVRVDQAFLREQAPKTKDPLVLQLGSGPARLGDDSFTFDIDSDGELDSLRTLGSGSVFVALDRDASGTIDDGSELFGARTGNGFEELAAFDSDQNGWIDEADPVFDQLRLWVPDPQGEGSLSKLAQRNVGAIYLGNVGSRFELKDAQGELGGVVQATGLWLTEDGDARVAQQVDLVAQPGETSQDE